jgi:hypothetical protein
MFDHVLFRQVATNTMGVGQAHLSLNKVQKGGLLWLCIQWIARTAA